jgi:radical SAM superfamily enzyme YgiQ (UPF0313 family)
MLSYSISQKLNRIFELGPIRPPSEAYSLLIRATRNCPWNRCRFCPVYKGSRFALRSVGEIISDIEAVKAISEGIKEAAWTMGHGGDVREAAVMLSHQPQCGPCVSHVALWLETGGKTAFLQDSNTLVMRTPDLIKVITYLRETFPTLKRVTTYGRSHTAARKSILELKELNDAGLDRIHIGLETGDDALLAYMEKGCTAKDHIEGGRKVKAAGISLCEYVMPDLGGKKMSEGHARQTAKVLNEIDPDYVRLRSLHVSPAMPLWTNLQDGDFELQTEDEVVREIAAFIENLHLTSYLKSDHILNLLMEVEGKMPEDKAKCLRIIDRYLSLTDEERLNFRMGRRAGLYSRLDDMSDGYKHDQIEKAIGHLKAHGSHVEQEILRLKNSFI